MSSVDSATIDDRHFTRFISETLEQRFRLMGLCTRARLCCVCVTESVQGARKLIFGEVVARGGDVQKNEIKMVPETSFILKMKSKVQMS